MNDAKCTSCGKAKHELKKRNSRVLKNSIMYLCGECVAAKMEPRGFLILAGRDGVDISFWIKPQRYHGEPITLRELS